MNQQTKLVLDTDILGDSSLQERFTIYIELLAHIVRRESKSLCLKRMSELSGISTTTLKRYFQNLSSAGILKKAHGLQDTWNLAKDPWDITLEDVFRSAISTCSTRRRSTKSKAARASDLGIEMLLMQALQAVDDHLYKILRTYSLDRLKASSAVPFPLSSRRTRPTFTEIDLPIS